MAHFYGTLEGARGPASRCGTKKSGIQSAVADWGGAVKCSAYVDDNTGEDFVQVRLAYWNGQGTDRILYDGPISGKRKRRKKKHETSPNNSASASSSLARLEQSITECVSQP